MKTEHQKRVEQFMRLAGQEIPDKPTIPSEEVRLLRARLILEEALETIDALGFVVCPRSRDDRPMTSGDWWSVEGISVELVEFHSTFPVSGYRFANPVDPYSHPSERIQPDLEQIADGVADISVVSIGTLSACGIADDPILREVDESNLRKFGPGGRLREDGKWIKPHDWEPPKISERLREQGG